MNQDYKKSELEYRLERVEQELKINECDGKHILHKEEKFEARGNCSKCFAFWEHKSPVLLELTRNETRMDVIYDKLDDLSGRLKKLEEQC